MNVHGAPNSARQDIDTKAGFVDGEPSSASAGQAVLAAEFVHATGGIDDLLLARVERMTGRADFDVQFLTECGTRIELVTAAADNLDLFVLRMNLGFHGACRLVPGGTGLCFEGREA